MFRGEREHCFKRVFKKTFRRTRNHHEVHNGSDTPVVKKSNLGEGVFVPNGASHPILNMDSEKRPGKDPNSLTTTPGQFCTQLAREPIFSTYETSHGGKRTGCGGTSDKCLREAKKKFKKGKPRPARR